MGETETYLKMTSWNILTNRWSKLLMALTFISCSSEPCFSDLEIVGEHKLVYCESKVFSGTAWSSDGKTMSITCHYGKVDSIMVYHANGCKAIKSTSLYGKGECFNNHGIPIGIEELMKYYPELIEQVATLSYEIKGL